MDADERDRLGEKLWYAIGPRWPWRSVEEWHREQYRIAAEAVLAAAPPWRPTEDEWWEIEKQCIDWERRNGRNVSAFMVIPIDALSALGYFRRPPAPDSGNAEGSA